MVISKQDVTRKIRNIVRNNTRRITPKNSVKLYGGPFDGQTIPLTTLAAEGPFTLEFSCRGFVGHYHGNQWYAGANNNPAKALIDTTITKDIALDSIVGEGAASILRATTSHKAAALNDRMDTLIDDLAVDLKAIVVDIEGSHATTRKHYGRYMQVLSKFASGDKHNAQFIALALIRAGANRQGIADAMRVSFGL